MAGLIPQHFIDELIARADIVEIIGSRVPLKKAGREYKACCPFHGEKTPSFTVSPMKQFYHCFGCGAHGTALGFLMEYDKLGSSRRSRSLRAASDWKCRAKPARPSSATHRATLYECWAGRAVLPRHPQGRYARARIPEQARPDA